MKKLWLLSCIVFVCVALFGCAAAADTAQQDPLAGGTVYETEQFSVTCAPGWDKMDIDGGVQLYKSDALLQITVRGYGLTQEDNVMIIETMLEMVDEASDITQVNMLGLDFDTATYTAFGMEQAIYAAIRDGEQLSIQLGGADHATDAVMQAMLGSVVLK